MRVHRVEPAAPPSRVFPGLLTANRSADVAFELGGVVAEVLVEAGSRVEAGTPLARLDARDLESRLNAARAESQRARADAERARTLLAQNAIAQARVDALEAAALAAEAAEQQASKALADAELRAPFGGIVAARFIDPFESVQPKAVAFRIHDLSLFTVAIDLPQALVVSSRQRRTDALEGVYFNAFFNDPRGARRGYRLEVGSFSGDPDPRTGTYRFKLLLQAPEELLLLPGMTCNVRISWSKEGPEAVRIPPTAVVTDDANRPFVWVVGTEGTVEPRFVTVGELTTEGLMVTMGLVAGEDIVTAGATRLTPGAEVHAL